MLLRRAENYLIEKRRRLHVGPELPKARGKTKLQSELSNKRFSHFEGTLNNSRPPRTSKKSGDSVVYERVTVMNVVNVVEALKIVKWTANRIAVP